MISHKNIVANTNSIIEYLSLSASDTIEVVLPFYYCYGLSLLHTHLRVGGSAVFNNNFIFIGSVINDIKKYNCTGFAGVPSHYQILLRKSTSFKSTTFPSLRYVTQAGGKLHITFQKEFTSNFPDIKFFVMYGQTEATARLAYLPPLKLEKKWGSIGIAIPGVELNLVDKHDHPINKAGEVGELVARGDNIMLGYHNDPDGTQQTLRNGWLHTSDLAYRDEEGYYYLTSRMQEIIKVGGERISPKEIEEVIVSIPEVIDCSVSGLYDENLGESIKAEIVVADVSKTVLTSDQVREHCSIYLSPHKIPHHIELKSKLEIAATGKKVKNQ
jgi:acyl-CoA synthetase (AMP-forming)/AMP-acid ligase II